MGPASFFTFCPRCGNPHQPHAKVDCVACGFVLYFSPASATAAFVHDDEGRWLFVRRAKEPSLGKIAPPGGFLNAGETAEEGVVREIAEEIGVGLRDLTYLGTFPNQYACRGVNYDVLDIFFKARIGPGDLVLCPEEIAGIEWLRTEEVSEEDLAFPSMKQAWRLIRDKNYGEF